MVEKPPRERPSAYLPEPQGISSNMRLSTLTAILTSHTGRASSRARNASPITRLGAANRRFDFRTPIDTCRAIAGVPGANVVISWRWLSGCLPAPQSGAQRLARPHRHRPVSSLRHRSSPGTDVRTPILGWYRPARQLFFVQLEGGRNAPPQ